MKEQKQLEVILSVFKGEKRSCKVGVARSVAYNFILAQYLNVALISAADREYKG